MKFIVLIAVLFLGLGACQKNDVLEESQAVSKSRLCPCPAVVDPVCGSDGVTYQNACEARCAGITRYERGECTDACKAKPPVSPCPCPHVYQPVCGCDGQTYGNACEAECVGIFNYSNGACGWSGIGR